MIQGEGFFPLALKVSACANGETLEYRLMMGPDQQYRYQLGKSVWRTPLVGDSQSDHAALALGQILGQFIS